MEGRPTCMTLHYYSIIVPRYKVFRVQEFQYPLQTPLSSKSPFDVHVLFHLILRDISQPRSLNTKHLSAVVQDRREVRAALGYTDADFLASRDVLQLLFDAFRGLGLGLDIFAIFSFA